MASIWIVVGKTEDPTRVWPVFWSVDEAQCNRVITVLREQQLELIVKLQAIWTTMEALRRPTEWKRRSGGVLIRNRAYDEELTTYQQARSKLEEREQTINVWAMENMLDALFPVGNEDWCPEVTYAMWPVYEDLRNDLTPGQLLLKRAQLHASESEDSMPEDESD